MPLSQPEKFDYKDKRGVSWEAFFVFDMYLARSARGEQCQGSDVAETKAEIDRTVTSPKK
jgi:hypothetical protein